MVSTANVSGEIRWRCRRGMLELDLLLNAFLDHQYHRLNDAESTVFDRLLDYPDQVLLELLLQQQVSSDKDINALVERIRQSATV